MIDSYRTHPSLPSGRVDLNVALKRQLGMLHNLYPVRIPTIYGGDGKKC
jgi:hypothetical protein